GRVAHEDPRRALRQLGEAMERIVLGGLPKTLGLSRGDFDGTLAPLIDLLELARSIDGDRRFAIVLDEFDEMPEELYLKGSLAETFFANVRALTTLPNFCLLLVGGENMPFVMERQGQKLNKFIRVNLTYFSRTDEWDDFVRLVRGPSEGVLTWHNDAVSAVFNLTNGNPYFSKLICKDVASRAVAERDGDITAEEVERSARDGVAALDMNAFMHLWEDGIRSPVEEREKIVLKRRRALAAVARCLRAGKPATLGNVFAHRGGAAIDERELTPILHNFVDRGVLVEGEHGFDVALPIFRLWLVEVGISRLANDGLSEELTSLQQRIEDEAFVRSAEIVTLTRNWGPYRGAQVGPETVRAWLEQRPSYRDQRALFDILKSVRVVRQDEIYSRLRSAGAVIRDKLGVYPRKSKADRRSDVVLTYLDGEGKSGQRYASDYAEENLIHVAGILPPSTFRSSLAEFAKNHGMPRGIVIVDDVVGTGGTLAGKVVEFFESHRDVILDAGMRFDVCAMFATEEGRSRVLEALAKLEYPLADLRIGEVLPKSLFAFHEPKGVFATSDEFDRAKMIAEDVGVTIYKNNPLGIGGAAALLVLPDTVPNNSLPLLHSASKDAERPWMPLFPRIANG
ncbi:MAG TPA: phosphoribosyltransferase, partial [Terriglobales bacterium]|nr:phosphoribosyltransferase [Terriglobales bacterium]